MSGGADFRHQPARNKKSARQHIPKLTVQSFAWPQFLEPITSTRSPDGLRGPQKKAKLCQISPRRETIQAAKAEAKQKLPEFRSAGKKKTPGQTIKEHERNLLTPYTPTCTCVLASITTSLIAASVPARTNIHTHTLTHARTHAHTQTHTHASRTS